MQCDILSFIAISNCRLLFIGNISIYSLNGSLTYPIFIIFYFLFIQVDAVDQQEREPLLEDGHGHGGLSLMFKNSHLK